MLYEHLRVDRRAPVALAAQLHQQLSSLIVSGVVEPGDRLPSVRELADRLGINLHTVRAAYHLLERDGLVSVRAGTGTTVLTVDRARLAGAVADVPSFTFGIILGAFSPFYAPVIRGIEAAAADLPALFFICDAQEDPRIGQRYLDRLIARGVDGIIALSWILPEGTELPPLDVLPVVLADFARSPGPGVEFDLQGGAEQVTRHLLEHGHRRIGYITPPPTWPTARPQRVGVEAALRAAGLELDPELIMPVPGYELEAGAAAASQLLDLADPPTAVLTVSDQLGLGVIAAARVRAVRIPEDLALAGMDDIQVAALVDPPLTTVHLPARELGERAMQLLRRLMSGQPASPAQEVLPTTLVVRQSCGCPRPAANGLSGEG
jgi:DNA-binding LacI/PurR family transcriptional regulator